MRLRWTSPALRDLEDIGDYIARDNRSAANRIVTTILDRAALLVDHPQMGRPGRVAGTRELVVAGTAYILPYRERGQDIEILAVYHGARRWPESFEGR